jgi:RNA polymerase sigma factor (sigma-70 family)
MRGAAWYGRAMSPEDLLARIAENRDRDAFCAFFRLYAPRVKAYVGRSVRDDVKADEITQEVMLTVWRRAVSYDPRRASASTWVFTIARNRMIDSIRKAGRPEVEPDDPTWVPAAAPAADAVAVTKRRAEKVREAMEALPQDQREVVDLAYFSFRSMSEISSDLGVPVGTVKSRVRLAFKRLRGALGSLGEPEGA